MSPGRSPVWSNNDALPATQPGTFFKVHPVSASPRYPTHAPLRKVGAAVPAARLGVLSLLCHAGGTITGGGDGTVTLFDSSCKDYAQTELRGGVVAMSFSADRAEVGLHGITRKSFLGGGYAACFVSVNGKLIYTGELVLFRGSGGGGTTALGFGGGK